MKEFFRRFGFTAAESAAIITLLLIFITGIIIKYTWQNSSEDFDYSAPDTEFREKTKLDFDKLKQSGLNELQTERSKQIKSAADSLYKIKDSSSSVIPLNRVININTAYLADLMMLPGVGEITAERIIDYREKNNGFKKIDELMKVEGIGEKKFAKIKPYISIE